MTTYKARELLGMDIDEIANLGVNTLTIEFEDGVSVKTTIRKTLYSRFFWQIHQNYDKLPVYSRHFVEHVLSKDGGVLNSGTHISLLAIISKDVIELYKLQDPKSKELLYTLIYQVTNNIYNEINKYIDSSVVTIDILDFLNLSFNAEVLAANTGLKPTPKNIERIHKKILEIISNSDPSNNIVKAIKAKMVNANQVTQCLSIRGYPSEVDGKVLSTPIMSNFTLGLNKLYDLVTESRSAAKSLYFSEAPLEDAEYFARRLQLMAMYVEHLDPVDCGSNDYIKWFIRPPEFNDLNEQVYAGDLKFMKGKWYLNETTNTLKSIEGNEKHLENTTILMRSVLTCKHPDKHTVCAVCFGKLSENINAYANLGHICAATMTRQTSQSVLSNKHYQGSSISTDLHLGEQLSRVFTISKSKTSLLLNSKLKSMLPKLIVTKDSALGLIDALSDDNTDDINPAYVSNIESLGVSLEINGIVITDEYNMLQSNRKCMLAKELIIYIREHKWGLDSSGGFIFDLVDWDYNDDLLIYPKKEYSFSDHSKQVAKIIETGVNDIIKRDDPESPAYTLKELFKLVNSKLNVNISLLEVIIYAVTTPREPGNQDLSRNYTDTILGVSDKVIKGRSLSNLYAYENQSNVIVTPEAFIPDNRPDSVYDIFCLPGEVLSMTERRKS